VRTPQTAPPGEFWTAKQAKRLRVVSEDSPARLGLFQRVFRGEESPRQCIKAFCLECAWLDTTVIRECTADACPLWRLRPYQGGAR
jgi:hypothetical protein